MNPLAKLAGGVLVVGFEGLEAPEDVQAWCEEGALAGVILFRRNFREPEDAVALLASLSSPPGEPLLLPIDQEGGRVARFGPPVLRLPPMRALGDLGDLPLLVRAGRVLGTQLAALGCTMDFAPILDVDTNPQNPVIGDRAFSRAPEDVIACADAFARGLHDGGVASCGKHFPGHGDTDLDSHFALPRLTHGRARLDAVELAPFRALAGVVPAMMTAHVVFDAIDPDRPATLSHRVMTGLLREELRYQGVIVSDDLEMAAVREHYGVADSACLAIEAGCDVLLVCKHPALAEEARLALVRRAEKDSAFRARLTDAAARTMRLRRAYPPRPVLDAAARRAIFESEEAVSVAREIAERT